MGWNIVYDFNDSDFIFSEKLIRQFVDVVPDKSSNQSVQWDAIKYMISEINYGGRVTDDSDRRLLLNYAQDIFKEEIISVPSFELSKYKPETEYKIPVNPADEVTQIKGRANPQQSDNNMNEIKKFYAKEIELYPDLEVPAIFGQHVNAEISSQIAEANLLLDSVISLSPKEEGSDGESRESLLMKTIQHLLPTIPENLDYAEAWDKNRPNDGNPIKIVLMQEIARYNVLLDKVRNTLIDLEKGLKG